MNESGLKARFEGLAKSLDGKVSFKQAGFFTPPFCPFKIRGVVNGVKITIFLGNDGGLATLDRFQAACPFGLAIFKPEPRLVLVKEITSAIRAPFPVYANPDDLHTDCIGRLFPDWSNWRLVLESFEALSKPIVICDAQSSFDFPFTFVPLLGASIRRLALRLSASPFKTVLDGQLASRYSDKPYVHLREDKISPVLRPLLPLAAKWSISDEAEVMRFANEVGPSAVREFITVFKLHRAEIERFCNTRTDDQPFGDEVVIFQLAFHAFALVVS